MLSEFEKLVESRRSVRKYDQSEPYDENVVKNALELAVLSPNSSNMQLWQFHRVRSDDKRQALAEACMGQSAAVTARELVAFVITPQKWSERSNFNANCARDAAEINGERRTKMALKYYEKLMPFIYKNDALGLRGLFRKGLTTVLGLSKPIKREVSKGDVDRTLRCDVAIAATTFVYAVKEQGYDTCMMGGFDSKRAAKILGLKKGEEVSVIVSVGKGIPDGIYGERRRVSIDKVVVEHLV